MKKVLIIDDERENLELISEMIRSEFLPFTASSPVEGLKLAVQIQPSAVLLDLNMPEMDGFEVCRRLREQPATRHIPVLMLTQQNGLDSRVKGLDIGADDYIAKPFVVRELLARIRARTRRVDEKQQSEAEIVVGNLRMDQKSMQVRVADEPIKLTQLEFDLLRYFLERPDQVIDRARLLADLWPDSVVTDRTVDTHVANLRKKIRGFDHSIQTIYGAGYLLRVAQ